MPLKPGDKAHDFTLLDQHGEPFSLAKSLKATKAPHLVYFYPKVRTRSLSVTPRKATLAGDVRRP